MRPLQIEYSALKCSTAGYAVCRHGLVRDASQLPLPRRVEKENLAAFISKKQEIFMVQMSLDIKRQEMQRLAQQAAQVIRPINSHRHAMPTLWQGTHACGN